jgi:hypothetical protein
MSNSNLIRGLTALPLVTAAAFLTACSGGSASPAVAAIGSPSASASATSTLTTYQARLAYSACIRAHGVPNFPDPQESAGKSKLVIGPGSGVDVNSPTFQAAMSACKALAPAGGAAAAGPSFDPTKIGPWTQCLRGHGLPKLPDPKNNGNGVSIDITGTGIDPALLEKAMSACQPQSPGGQIGLIDGGSQ